MYFIQIIIIGKMSDMSQVHDLPGIVKLTSMHLFPRYPETFPLEGDKKYNITRDQSVYYL